MSATSKLPLKLETFSSLHFYVRKIIILRKSIKKASRLGTESLELLPSLNTKLSGIHSTAVSCAAEDPCGIAAYTVALMRVLEQFNL